MNSEKTVRKINAVLVVALAFTFLQYLYMQRQISFHTKREAGAERWKAKAWDLQLGNARISGENRILREENRLLSEQNDSLKKDLQSGATPMPQETEVTTKEALSSLDGR